MPNWFLIAFIHDVFHREGRFDQYDKKRISVLVVIEDFATLPQFRHFQETLNTHHVFRRRKTIYCFEYFDFHFEWVTLFDVLTQNRQAHAAWIINTVITCGYKTGTCHRDGGSFLYRNLRFPSVPLWKTLFNWLSRGPPACEVSFYWKTTGIVIKYEWSNTPSVALFRNNTITKANNSEYTTTRRFCTGKKEQIENEKFLSKTLQQTHWNSKPTETNYQLLLVLSFFTVRRKFSSGDVICSLLFATFLFVYLWT